MRFGEHGENADSTAPALQPESEGGAFGMPRERFRHRGRWRRVDGRQDGEQRVDHAAQDAADDHGDDGRRLRLGHQQQAHAHEQDARKAGERGLRNRKAGGRHDADGQRPDAGEGLADGLVVLQLVVEHRYDQREHERDGHGGDGAQDAAGNAAQRVADGRRSVHGHGAGRHLGDGHEVHEHLGRDELLGDDELLLDEGQHRVPAAEGERADLQKRQAQAKQHWNRPPSWTRAHPSPSRRDREGRARTGRRRRPG